MEYPILSDIATAQAPHECGTFWHAFLLTDEYSDSPYDDWVMYCAGQEL